MEGGSGLWAGKPKIVIEKNVESERERGLDVFGTRIVLGASVYQSK